MNYQEEIFAKYASNDKIGKNTLKKILISLDIDPSTINLKQDNYTFNEFSTILDNILQGIGCQKDSILKELSSTDSTFAVSYFKSKTVSTSDIDLFFAESF